MTFSPAENAGENNEQEGEEELQVNRCLHGEYWEELDKDSQSGSADSGGIVEYE